MAGGDLEILVSVVICTKDRLEDPVRCIESLLCQTRLPDEIVIIDASGGDQLKKRIEETFAASRVPLVYKHSKPGLTYQRNVSLGVLRGEVVFFFDDDVVLEPDFLAEILRVFENDVTGQVGGVMGRIVNLPHRRWLLNLYCRVFCLSRPGNGRFLRSGLATFPCNKDGEVLATDFLSGGITAYHQRVLKEFSWDESLEGYALMEDADFSYRVSRRFRNYYVPAARCSHYPSPIGGDRVEKLRRTRFRNHRYLFEKNMPKSLINWFAFWLAVIGTGLLFLYGDVVRWFRPKKLV